MIILNLLSLNTETINSFVGLTMSFLLDIILIIVIIGYIYRSHNINKSILFSLYLFNIVVFALTISFRNEALSMGSGFGMFVVFAMMRYRSEVVSLKDMTYLLIVITLGILHGTLYASGGITQIIFLDLAILLTVFILEKRVLCKNQCYKKIKYNNLEMIKPENKEKLWEEISQKTGLNVIDIKIEGLNLMDNRVTLCVYYADENAMKIVKSSNVKSLDKDVLNVEPKSLDQGKGIAIFQKFGTRTLKRNNSLLLMILLIALTLIFGVTMDGFAILT